MGYAKIEEDIVSTFKLQIAPIAMAFADWPPHGVQNIEGEHPSLCTFWRKAETNVFFAPADKHFNCPVGAMVLGFEMPPEVQEELKTLVQKMCHSSYLHEDEPGRIPVIAQKRGGVVYGPLKDFPIEPQLILFWMKPSQAMIYSEALGSCKWTEDTKTLALGRPACAAIPTALEESNFSLSLGCIGMRTFTEIGDENILATLNFKEVDSFLKNLKVTVFANKEMLEYYVDKKNKIAG